MTPFDRPTSVLEAGTNCIVSVFALLGNRAGRQCHYQKRRQHSPHLHLLSDETCAPDLATERTVSSLLSVEM